LEVNGVTLAKQSKICFLKIRNHSFVSCAQPVCSFSFAGALAQAFVDCVKIERLLSNDFWARARGEHIKKVGVTPTF